MMGSARPLFLLACICAALGWLVTVSMEDLRRPLEVPPLVVSAPAATDYAYVLPEPAAVDVYQALLDRSPFEVALEEPVADDLDPFAEEPSLTPVAIITSPEHSMVLLEAEGERSLIRATLGDEINGRLILEIKPAALVLEGPDGDIDVVKLRAKTAEDQQTPLFETAKPSKPIERQPAPSPDRTPKPPEGLNRDLPIWTPDALGQLVSTVPTNDPPR